MKKLLMSVAALLLGWGMVSAQNYSDLIISEYVEGSSNNKAIELYNGTGSDIDLSAYSLKKQTNGAGEYKNEVTLEGTLKAGATYVIVNSSANISEMLDLANLKENTITAFNGNDAVKLYKNGVAIDAVGVDTDPSDWGKDVTLRRKCDKGPNATYTPDEWETAETDDWSDLGAHCGTVTADETAPEIDFIVSSAAKNTEVEVHFTEAVEQTSALTVANYAINNDITVSDAKMGTNEKTVVLTTSAMTDGTVYELTVNGVKDAAGNATENLKHTFTFGAIEVDDIAAVLALRDTYVNAQQYRIKGEVVVVAHVGKNIYVQDKDCENTKGHSLMLYDQPGTYADKFPAGTVLTNVAGSLTIYNNLLEMQYLAEDITENGTAEPVVSQALIKDAYNDVLYHAALVKFVNVEFDDAGTTFEAKGGDGNGNYRMDEESTGKYMFLHVYATDNIVGEKVPTGKCSVTGYVGVYQGKSQLILRDKSDIVAGETPVDPSANENGAAVKFAAYPNPTDGMLTLDVEESNYNVRVYTVAGVEVMNLKALNGKTQINLEGMAKGIYVVEIATANGASYAKIVLR